MVCYNICEARTVGRDKPGRCRVEDLSHQRLARQCLVEWGSGPGEKAPHHTVPAAQTFTARSGGPVESGAAYLLPEHSASLASASSLTNRIPNGVMATWPASLRAAPKSSEAQA